MRHFLLFTVVFLSEMALFANLGAPPISQQVGVLSLSSVQQIAVAATDPKAEIAADAAGRIDLPVRFAVAQPVQLSPDTSGTWEQVSGGRLWRLRIVSKGATDLNFAFTNFWLPQGATLYVIAESENYFQGPYTAQDGNEAGQLWTPVIPGAAAVIELFVPTSAIEEPRLVLTQVGAGYLDLFHRQKDALQAKAGTCEIDVVCPQAAPWTNEIRSVARYSISGTTLCSGTLITDAAGDFRNFFLTANHCGLSSANSASVVVYWNYESPTCGQHGGGSLAQNQSGAIFRAAKTDVDFALIELSSTPSSSFKVYYSGWDRSGSAPAGCVGIHHPNGDEKSISFSSNPLTTVNSCIGSGGSSTHWQVIWTSGVTEPGSSGSGIWDPTTHRLLGTLSGGGSACSTPTSPDCYGKFSVAWASGKSSADRLVDWLDPQSSGVTSVPGMDPAQLVAIAAGGASLLGENCLPTNGVIDPGESVTVNFSLKNNGGMNTTNLTATLLATNGVVLPGAPQDYGAIAGGGSAVSRSFTFTAAAPCGSTINPVFQLQDGTKNLGTVSFALPLGVSYAVTAFSENFDGVVAPARPAGWTSSISGTGTAWATSTAQRDTLPNSFFAGDPSSVSDNQLVSPVITIPTATAQLAFRHFYNTESGYDGGALEFSVNGGSFADIIASGGSFVTNGYNQTLSTAYQNPLAGRSAWSGNSGGFITTIVNVPSGSPGRTVQFRWRLGSDNSVSSTGWYVDTVSVSQIGFSCCTPPPMIVNTRPALPDSIAFSFDTVTGLAYVVQAKTNLITTNWTSLLTNAGTGARQSFTNSTPGMTQGEFRLHTQ